MTTLFLAAAAVLAEPDAKQLPLLKTFRQEFIEITPGKGKFPASFMMGDKQNPAAQPVHKVTFQYSFHVARYEVPQNLWQAVMGANPSKWKGPRNSVEMLSWQEAAEFSQKATKLMRAAKLIGQKQVIRLPSEAEWEYTTRAGAATRYSFGDAVKDLDAYGWHTGNAAGNDPPVGAKKPNPWGLYDVHGYLWEWCADEWRENYQAAPADGSPWTGQAKPSDKAPRHVLRGGSWKDKAELLTSAYRQGLPRGTKGDHIGLRCVLANE